MRFGPITVACTQPLALIVWRAALPTFLCMPDISHSISVPMMPTLRVSAITCRRWFSIASGSAVPPLSPSSAGTSKVKRRVRRPPHHMPLAAHHRYRRVLLHDAVAVLVAHEADATVLL